MRRNYWSSDRIFSTNLTIVLWLLFGDAHKNWISDDQIVYFQMVDILYPRQMPNTPCSIIKNFGNSGFMIVTKSQFFMWIRHKLRVVKSSWTLRATSKSCNMLETEYDRSSQPKCSCLHRPGHDRSKMTVSRERLASTWPRRLCDLRCVGQDPYQADDGRASNEERRLSTPVRASCAWQSFSLKKRHALTCKELLKFVQEKYSAKLTKSWIHTFLDYHRDAIHVSRSLPQEDTRQVIPHEDLERHI
jgi:hypothetical protein